MGTPFGAILGGAKDRGLAPRWPALGCRRGGGEVEARGAWQREMGEEVESEGKGGKGKRGRKKKTGRAEESDHRGGGCRRSRWRRERKWKWCLRHQQSVSQSVGRSLLELQRHLI